MCVCVLIAHLEVSGVPLWTPQEEHHWRVDGHRFEDLNGALVAHVRQVNVVDAQDDVADLVSRARASTYRQTNEGGGGGGEGGEGKRK